MGSKKPILDFVTSAISEVHEDGNIVCDLFAGSCSISAALRSKYDFISNDIQVYSSILGQTYFSNFKGYNSQELLQDILLESAIHSFQLKNLFPECVVDYSSVTTLREYSRVEAYQRELVKKPWPINDFNLFSKNYAGTYWSFEQCTWIDAIRKSADSYSGLPIRACILSSLMYAMSYTTQSTGHFAQYRDGSDRDAMNDILSYRIKSLPELFKKKFIELTSTLVTPVRQVATPTLNYIECLDYVPPNSTIYADPPYAPVHYSRFYHALETLVRYDYPEIEFKGRYRNDRHQSLFSKRGTVSTAFSQLFDKIIERNCRMVLSYSNKGVLDIEELIALARQHFQRDNYFVTFRTLDYVHSTMGRFDDRQRDVIEYLVIANFE